MRVLVAEDDEDLAGQMVASLKDAGYAVDHADNGEDAHFMGDTEPYDAVILDLGLPMLDGISVLNLWRQLE
jgi:two-component system OmpR family response regulator